MCCTCSTVKIEKEIMKIILKMILLLGLMLSQTWSSEEWSANLQVPLEAGEMEIVAGATYYTLLGEYDSDGELTKFSEIKGVEEKSVDILAIPIGFRMGVYDKVEAYITMNYLKSSSYLEFESDQMHPYSDKNSGFSRPEIGAQYKVNDNFSVSTSFVLPVFSKKEVNDHSDEKAFEWSVGGMGIHSVSIIDIIGGVKYTNQFDHEHDSTQTSQDAFLAAVQLKMALSDFVKLSVQTTYDKKFERESDRAGWEAKNTDSHGWIIWPGFEINISEKTRVIIESPLVLTSKNSYDMTGINLKFNHGI